jgi:hypothetical protein
MNVGPANSSVTLSTSSWGKVHILVNSRVVDVRVDRVCLCVRSRTEPHGVDQALKIRWDDQAIADGKKRLTEGLMDALANRAYYGHLPASESKARFTFPLLYHLPEDPSSDACFLLFRARSYQHRRRSSVVTQGLMARCRATESRGSTGDE